MLLKNTFIFLKYISKKKKKKKLYIYIYIFFFRKYLREYILKVWIKFE